MMEKTCAKPTKNVCHDQQSLPARSPSVQYCQQLFLTAAGGFTHNTSAEAAAVPFCRRGDIW